MAAEGMETVEKRRRTASLLMDMAMSDCDEIVELDLTRERIRNVRHTEGKYFVPIVDGAFRDVILYSAANMIHPEDREQYLRVNDPDTMLARLSETTDGVLCHSVRYRLLGGGWRWTERVLVDGRRHGLPEGLVYVFVFDVDEEMSRKAGQPGAEFAAERNELTGLLNERAFFNRAKELLRAKPDGWCVLAIDLEHFRLFNEWYGREQGDLLLAQIGAKLARVEEFAGGVACYLGQDDFALLAPYDRERTRELYELIHRIIKEYGNSVGFMPAFGVAPADGESSIEEICDRAAIAARRAKDNYHTRIRVFEPSMYQQTEKDYHILSDFQKALREHELFVMLQPQCSISTGKVVGAESLVRWRKADGEMIPPGVFVPVLERYGFVTDLDQYVWEEVCAWLKRWIDGGNTPLPVSVNVSQIDIYTIDVPAFFDALVKKYSLPVETVKIEITESAYVDNESVADTVRRLRELGFLVLMDDFGSGYSSLNMLRNLNVDIIKLDAQFLRMSGDDRQKGMQIMETIVNMAESMSVPIIVEGVETKEESDFLAGLGCRYVQGYYFYRPMPEEDFEKLIADPRQIDTRGFRFKTKEQFHVREFLDRGVFSDSTLNNILGPMVLFRRKGGEVDVARYNRQFLQEARLPRTARDFSGVQRYVLEEDLPRFLDLFDRAKKEPIDGAGGVVRFRLPDGSLSRTRFRVFFMEEKGAKQHKNRLDKRLFDGYNKHGFAG